MECTKMNKGAIIELAEALASDLLADVALASTRMEHVRVSSRANAAQILLIALKETERDDSNDSNTEVTIF
jgi:hypothetical protein